MFGLFKSSPSHARATARTMRHFQDTIYALLVLGVSAAFMLFLLGSTSLQSSLTIIGMLLCLCMVGGTLRFLSGARVDNDLMDRQDDLDQNLNVLQHRVGDHDLTLLKMAGQIEGLETGLRAVRVTQKHAETRHQEFMSGLKDRMLQLVTVLSRPRGQPAKTAKPGAKATAKAKTPAAFTPPPAVNINAEPIGPTSTKETANGETHRYDDDVFVSPGLMRDALDIATRNRRIDVYVQPIVTLPQQKLNGFDVYGRVRLQPGVYIPARQYRGFATHIGQQIALDHLVLRELGNLSRGTKLPLFINLTLAGLVQPDTLMTIAGILKDHPNLRHQLVINVSQKDLGHVDERAEKIITQLVATGIKFGVNDIQTTDLDLNLMARLKFTYLKLSHDKLVTTKLSDTGASLTQRFITRVQARNMTLIAGMVETREQLRPLLDYPIAMAQGYAFGRPDRPITYQKRAIR